MALPPNISRLEHAILGTAETIRIAHEGEVVEVHVSRPEATPGSPLSVQMERPPDVVMGRAGEWYVLSHRLSSMMFRFRDSDRPDRFGHPEFVALADRSWRIRWDAPAAPRRRQGAST